MSLSAEKFKLMNSQLKRMGSRSFAIKWGQVPFVFYGTIDSNIRLHNRQMSLADVKEAVEFVQAHEFI